MLQTRKLIRTIILVVFAIIVIGYSAFELRGFFEGPSITVTSPLPGETIPVTGTYVMGTAKNVTFLYLNGRQIYTDELGTFKEYVLFPKGYNSMTLEAVGKFNKKVKKTIALVSL